MLSEHFVRQALKYATAYQDENGTIFDITWKTDKAFGYCYQGSEFGMDEEFTLTASAMPAGASLLRYQVITPDVLKKDNVWRDKHESN